MPKPLEKELMQDASAVLKEGEENPLGTFGRDIFPDKYMDDEILVQCLAGAFRARGPAIRRVARKVLADELTGALDEGAIRTDERRKVFAEVRRYIEAMPDTVRDA